MIFSKKYKYSSNTKTKKNKFFFFFSFYSFLFSNDFFFLIFQKKSSNLFEFLIDRKQAMKRGFNFRKTSSTYFRYLLLKYKPFFKGFNSLSFDFHFFCYSLNKNIEKVKECLDFFETKEMLKKYEVIFTNYKGRFYTKEYLGKTSFFSSSLEKKKEFVFKILKLILLTLKKINLLFFTKKLLFKK